MADYFTHFSCLLDVGTPDKAARALGLFQGLREADQDADDPEVAGFDIVRQDAPEGSSLWIHDDEHGDVEAGVVCGRGRNPTLRLWPAIFSGEIDVFPSERRNMGQEIGR